MQIRPLIQADREPVSELITAHFTVDRSYEFPVNDECDGTVARVAEEDGEIIGVMALSTYTAAEDLCDAMHLIDTVDLVPQRPMYGLVHAGYTAPERTGEGIGSQLLAALHDIGTTNGVDVFVADAWFHGGPDSPAELLAAYGYDIVHTHSIAGHADGTCHKCPGSCTCEAALAVRTTN